MPNKVIACVHSMAHQHPCNLEFTDQANQTLISKNNTITNIDTSDNNLYPSNLSPSMKVQPDNNDTPSDIDNSSYQTTNTNNIDKNNHFLSSSLSKYYSDANCNNILDHQDNNDTETQLYFGVLEEEDTNKNNDNVTADSINHYDITNADLNFIPSFCEIKDIILTLKAKEGRGGGGNSTPVVDSVKLSN